MPSSPSTAAPHVERECWRAAGLVALGGAAAAVMLWASTFPGWPIAAGIILSVLVLAAVLVTAGAHQHPAARWLVPAAMVAALALAIIGGALANRAGAAALEARFDHSRPDFEVVVASSGRLPSAESDQWLPFPGHCPARIGTYRIAECHGFTGGLMFLQARDALGDDAGFAYAPHGLPATGAGESGISGGGFTHLVGPWYAWTCGC